MLQLKLVTKISQSYSPSDQNKLKAMADCILLITYQHVKHMTLEY